MTSNTSLTPLPVWLTLSPRPCLGLRLPGTYCMQRRAATTCPLPKRNAGHVTPSSILLVSSSGTGSQEPEVDCTVQQQRSRVSAVESRELITVPTASDSRVVSFA
ncbi:hypothetical protein IWZ03DRAFT_41714 [Phyllosticta citriasiana]|uniref:Uncharacterized protein n=1 Tax=Phyllosticta citriasiana TaxID=595635 RepID=A0ABR1KG16_9PEZI